MNLKRAILFLALAVPCGIAAFLLAQRLAGKVETARLDRPGLKAPQVIDLGERNPGKCETRFFLSNSGTQPLELTRFRTSCGCMAVREDRADANARLESVTIPPGESISIVAEVSVRFGSDHRFRADLTFGSNDPDQPEVIIPIVAESRVKISASPPHWLLGSFTRPVRLNRRILLIDDGQSGSAEIERVVSNDPDLVQVRFVAGGVGGAGEIELDFIPPSRPRQIAVEVLVYLKGSERPLLTIPVTGEYASRIQVMPPAIVLPQVRGGKPSYTATCNVVSRLKEPFRLSAQAPATLRVNVAQPDELRAEHAITVEWLQDARPKPGETQTAVIMPISVFNDGQEANALNVFCRQPEVCK